MRAVAAGTAASFQPSAENIPRLMVAAGLAHVATLVDGVRREFEAGRAIGAEILARANMEAVVATIYLTLAPAEATTYLRGAAARSLKRTQVELGQHDAAVKREWKRIDTENRRRQHTNAAILAKNEGEGTTIPLRPLLAKPYAVLMDFDQADLISSLIGDDEEDSLEHFSMSAVVGRIKALTSGTKDALNLSNVYSGGYRILSLYAAHPSATLLARYADLSGPTWSVRQEPIPPPTGMLHHTLFMALLVAERAAQFFEEDSSWFAEQLRLMPDLTGDGPA